MEQTKVPRCGDKQERRALLGQASLADPMCHGPELVAVGTKDLFPLAEKNSWLLGAADFSVDDWKYLQCRRKRWRKSRSGGLSVEQRGRSAWMS